MAQLPFTTWVRFFGWLAAGVLIIGFDGTDSGEDAIALGLVLARATRTIPLVAVVHLQEYPIGGDGSTPSRPHLSGQHRRPAVARVGLAGRGGPRACATRRRSGWAGSPSPTSTPPRPATPWTWRPAWPSASGPGGS